MNIPTIEQLELQVDRATVEESARYAKTRDPHDLMQSMAAKAGSWKAHCIDLLKLVKAQHDLIEDQAAVLSHIDEHAEFVVDDDGDEVDLTDERFAEDARAFYSRAVREGGRG